MTAIIEHLAQLVTALVMAAQPVTPPVVPPTPNVCCTPPPTLKPGPLLSCIAFWESHNGEDPRALGNIYQFTQRTFNAVAARLGRIDLVGRPPGTASRADQDTLAQALLDERGLQPWPTPERRCS